MDLAELQAIAENERHGWKRTCIRCCTAASCLSSNGQAVKDKLEEAVTQAGLGDRVQVCAVGCMRLCCQGPLVQVDPDGTMYEKVAPAEAPSIIESLNGGTAIAQRGDAQQPFFTRQMSIVLENSGR